MWIATKNGYFSIVQKEYDPPGILTVRGRVQSDVDDLRQRLKPQVGNLRIDDAADYKYRFCASDTAIASIISADIMALNYDNFKSRIYQDSPHRAKIYGECWYALAELSQLDEPEISTAEALTIF